MSVHAHPMRDRMLRLLAAVDDPDAVLGIDDADTAGDDVVLELAHRFDRKVPQVNDETTLPTIPARMPDSRWNQRDDGHYRAIVAASTETFAVLSVEAGEHR